MLCGLFRRVRHDGQSVVDCITKCYCRVFDLSLQAQCYVAWPVLYGAP